MKACVLALPIAVFSIAGAAPATAQLFGKPVYPRQDPTASIVQVQSFAGYRELYAHIAATRGLADPESDFAIEQIESGVSLDHLRDYSGDSIVVAKLERAETPGSYSFFVLREVGSRLRLLGQMSACGYETTTQSGHLEFVLDMGKRTAQPPRYQVDGDFLINLADLASLDRDDPVEIDFKHAF